MLGRRSQPRFNLVLLTQNEDYISDYICIYSRGGNKDFACSGRLKLCSQSLFIDPDSYEYPVYRIRFKDIDSLELIDINANSRSEYVTSCLSSLSSTGCSVALVLHSKSITEMKHLGQDTPYSTVSLRGASVVTAIVLPYSNLTTEFPLINRLSEFSMLPDYLSHLESLLELRTKSAVFDTTSLNNIKEKQLLETAIPCMFVGPLQQSRSLIMVTDAYLYIQPLVQDAGQSRSSKFVISYAMRSIVSVMKRRRHLRHIAAEIFLNDLSENSSIFLSFYSTEIRDLLCNIVVGQANLSQPSLPEIVNSWVSGTISNFDYIMSLNRFCTLTVCWKVLYGFYSISYLPLDSLRLYLI